MFTPINFVQHLSYKTSATVVIHDFAIRGQPSLTSKLYQSLPKVGHITFEKFLA